VFEISIDENKTIPFATLAEFITGKNIESVLWNRPLKALTMVDPPANSIGSSATASTFCVYRSITVSRDCSSALFNHSEIRSDAFRGSK